MSLSTRDPAPPTVVALSALAWLAGPSLAADDGLEPPRGHILSSCHLGYTWSDDIIAGIRDAFSAAGQPVEFFYAFLDAKRYRETRAFQDHVSIFCKSPFPCRI